MTFRPLALLPALLPALVLAACATPPTAQRAGVPGVGPDAARSARAAACLTEAERVVRYRDRGQLMRQDDYNARIGTSSYLGPQVISDGYAQIYERDRLAAECVRGANAAEAPQIGNASAAPAAVPEPPPAPTRRGAASRR